MSTNRHHSPETKASALAALILNEGNVLRTATQLGLAESTLRGFVAAAEGEQGESLRRLREQKRTALQEKFERLADEMLDLVERKKDQLSPRDAMICAGIAVDKFRLLGDQPTSISRSDAGSQVKIEERLKVFRDHYESRSVSITVNDIEEAKKFLAAGCPASATPDPVDPLALPEHAALPGE